MLKVISIFVVLLTIFGCESRNDNKKNLDLNQSNNNSTTSQSTKEIKPTEQKKREPIVLEDAYANRYTVTSPKEHLLKISGMENKVVLFEFFATWCEPCLGMIPHLNSIKDKFKDDLEVIGVLLEDDMPNKELLDFINAKDIRYTIFNSKNNEELLRLNGNIKVIPYMVLYDKDGNFVTNYYGLIPEEMVTQDIKKVVEK